MNNSWRDIFNRHTSCKYEHKFFYLEAGLDERMVIIPKKGLSATAIAANILKVFSGAQLYNINGDGNLTEYNTRDSIASYILKNPGKEIHACVWNIDLLKSYLDLCERKEVFPWQE